MTYVYPESPEAELCDFCGRGEMPLWVFDCCDFTVDAMFGFQGAWSACDDCRLDIEMDRRTRLLARAVAEMVRQQPGTKAVAEQCLREAHEAFFKFRIPGRPERRHKPVAYA